MFEDFGPKHGRRDSRRFGLSLVASGLCYAAIGGGIVAASAAARKAVKEEELVQIEFAPPPEPVAEPEPPPPPPPEVAPPPSSPRPKVQRQELKPPTDVPDEKPPESDAKLVDAPPPGSGQDGFLDGVAGGKGTAPAPVAPPPPPPPPAPVKAAGPVHLPESASAPVAKASNTPPEYPEAARKAGVQAVVVAKLVIAADGRVTSVEIMRGPDIFHEPVRRALLAWRYEPARLPDGTALTVFRIVQLPFKLENM